MKLYEQMFEHTVRIAVAWPFPVSPIPDRLADHLETTGELPPELKALTAGWTQDEIDQLFGGEREAQDSFEELCGTAFRKGVSGWLGVASCPVFKPFDGNGGMSFSWGHTNFILLFAPTADALLEKAIAWAKERYDAARSAGGAS